MPTIQDKLNRFKENHGVTFTLDTIDRIPAKFRYLDNFLFEKENPHPHRDKYWRGLMYVINAHVEKRLTLNPAGAYDFSTINVTGIIHDYEEIMAQRYEENEKDQRKRGRYEGMKALTLLDKVEASLKQNYNQKLSGVWADQLIKGTLSLDKMKNVAGINDLAIRQNSENAPQALANVIRLKQAMDSVSEKRSWLWYATHWVGGIQEYLFRKDLQKKLVEYSEDLNYDVATVTTEVADLVVTGAITNIEAFREKAKDYKKTQQLNQEQTAQHNETLRSPLPEVVTEQSSVPVAAPVEPKPATTNAPTNGITN